MVVFPNAKINIGLHVTKKRADGFHDLETLFYPLPFYDVLEIVPAAKTTLSLSGLETGGAPEDNLCLKAYRLLQEAFNIPPVAIYLHKVIPAGAGLGGGSSDAAYTLKALDALFNLQLTAAQFLRYAVMLGSDCAFFLHRRPMLATGRGEVLSPFPLYLQSKYMIVVKPSVFVSTAAAYADIVPAPPAAPLADILRRPPEQWKDTLSNDFEATIFARFPVLALAKRALYAAGALYASMSGSGAALYGIFEEETTGQQAKTLLNDVLFAGVIGKLPVNSHELKNKNA